jgi:cytochrome c peroxidase
VPQQTLPADSLHLNAREVSDLVLFLHALTDTAGTTARPDKLPRFPDHRTWNKRTVGGDY